MRISKKTDYALRVMVELAAKGPGAVMSIRRLAEENDIPKRFLEQIMIELRNKGWVSPIAGRHGGYKICCDPEKLTMGRIIRHFNGVLSPIGCVSAERPKPCSQELKCRFRRVFLNVRNHVVEMLDRLTLADIAQWRPLTAEERAGIVMGDGDGI